MRISDWSSDVCSADLSHPAAEPSRLFLSAGRACCGSHRAAAGRPQHSSTRATTREDRRMKDMKAYLAGALLAAAVATVAGAPGAQAFPEREIEVIVNYGAGGGTDLSTRVLADAAAKILGQDRKSTRLNSSH